MSVSESIAIHRGLANGFFGAPTSYLAEIHVGAMSIVDFDGDGLLDVLATISGPIGSDDANAGVALLRGIGGGAFQLEIGARGMGAGNVPGLAPADVDADGDLDVVFAILLAYGETDLGLLPGGPTGDVRFGREISTATEWIRGGIGSGDFDDDGRDLIVGDRAAIWVLHGAPLDQFVVAHTIPLAPDQYADEVIVEDLDGDAIEDAVVLARRISWSLGAIEVFTGRPDGTIRRAPSFPSHAGVASFDLGEIDGDGRKDLLVSTTTIPALRYHRHLAGAQFGAPIVIPVHWVP